MEKEKSVADNLPAARHFIAKPISLNRAQEICATLGASFSDDERVDLLTELVLGLCANEEGLKAAGMRDFEIVDYHDMLGATCAVELFRHTRQGWNAACQHLFDVGIAWEWKNGKAVSQ